MNSPVWSKMNCIRDCMVVLFTCKFDEDLIKKSLSSGQHFPHYKSIGAIGCHGNRSFDPICAKNFMPPYPYPVLLHIKIRIGLLASEILKFESVGRTTDDGRTDSVPLVYYKLTVWAMWVKMYPYLLESTEHIVVKINHFHTAHRP